MVSDWYSFINHESMRDASILVEAGVGPHMFAAGVIYLRSSRLSSLLARAMISKCAAWTLVLG